MNWPDWWDEDDHAEPWQAVVFWLVVIAAVVGLAVGVVPVVLGWWG